MPAGGGPGGGCDGRWAVFGVLPLVVWVCGRAKSASSWALVLPESAEIIGRSFWIVTCPPNIAAKGCQSLNANRDVPLKLDPELKALQQDIAEAHGNLEAGKFVQHLRAFHTALNK